MNANERIGLLQFLIGMTIGLVIYCIVVHGNYQPIGPGLVLIAIMALRIRHHRRTLAYCRLLLRQFEDDFPEMAESIRKNAK